LENEARKVPITIQRIRIGLHVKLADAIIVHGNRLEALISPVSINMKMSDHAVQSGPFGQPQHPMDLRDGDDVNGGPEGAVVGQNLLPVPADERKFMEVYKGSFMRGVLVVAVIFRARIAKYNSQDFIG
jgi:hypothetical protein